MVRDCPKCGLVNPPTAERCDCGYDFAAKKVLGSYLSDKDLNRDKDAEPEQGVTIAWSVFGKLFKFLGG